MRLLKAQAFRDWLWYAARVYARQPLLRKPCEPSLAADLPYGASTLMRSTKPQALLLSILAATKRKMADRSSREKPLIQSTSKTGAAAAAATALDMKRAFLLRRHF